jgi:hypothetical protein
MQAETNAARCTALISVYSREMLILSVLSVMFLRTVTEIHIEEFHLLGSNVV